MHRRSHKKHRDLWCGWSLKRRGPQEARKERGRDRSVGRRLTEKTPGRGTKRGSEEGIEELDWAEQQAQQLAEEAEEDQMIQALETEPWDKDDPEEVPLEAPVIDARLLRTEKAGGLKSTLVVRDIK